MSQPSRIIQLTLKASAIFAILTGSLDVCLGTEMLGGESVFQKGLDTTAVADSQIRFFGATWAGYGAMLWWASEDLKTRRVPLALLGAISVAAGVGRSLSTLKHGSGATWTQVAMWAELVGPGTLYIIGRSQRNW